MDDLGWLTQAVGTERAALLRPHLEAVDVADGERILVDGEPSAFLFLVVEGEVVVVVEGQDGTRLELGVRPAGSWLGEVGFVDGGPATATVVARGPARVLRIDHATLVRLANERPDVASVLLRQTTRQLAERIARSSSGIVERVGPGQVRVHKPAEVRGWVSQVLGWLIGGAGASR